MMAYSGAEEYYDILNEDGSKTGQTLPKSAVHNKELLHGSVFIWIYNKKGEVLLQLRSKDKKSFPGVWDVSVAGHISAGDTPLEAAVREIKEEIGVDIVAEDLTQVDFMSDIVPWVPDKTHPELCWVYILHRELDLTQLAIKKSELAAVKLLPIQELQAERQKPNSHKFYAARNPRMYDIAFQEIEKKLTE